jgi:plasmid stabilization system protein ParE
MNFRFLDDARTELYEAQEHYDRCEPGLGDAFCEAVVQAVEEIVSDPERSPHLSRQARRFLLKRFPYSLIYQVRDTEILILSVFHLSRRPGSWRKNC